MEKFFRYGIRAIDKIGMKEIYTDIYESFHAYVSGLVCKPDEEVYALEFSECAEEECNMYGWWSNEDEKVILIYPSLQVLSVCFPYGIDSEIQRGLGRIVPLKVISSVSCGRAGQLKSHRANWDKS